MPIDSSIARGIQPVQPMQSLASVVGLANGLQGLKQQQQQIDMNAIKLREQQNLVPFLQDPSNYSDGNGQVDHAKLYNGVMKLAPTTGAERIQQFEQAQQAQTVAKSQILALGDEKRGVLGRLMYGVDPDKPELVNKMFDVAKAVNPEASDALDYGLKLYNSAPPDQRGDIMKQIAMTVLPQQTQQQMATGQVMPIPTASGTQLVQIAQGAAQPQGTKIGEAFTPPNQIVSTPNGSAGVANTATGTVTPMKAPEMVTYYPPGESADTVKALQDQRTSQQQQLQSLPERQNIYKNIIDLADKGTPTGMYGSLWQKFGSLTGYHFSGDATADRNALGKWLEQEAARNAQAMGVHTNAGLESSKAQGGTPEYDDKTIAHIARTGAANAQGVLLYNQGLERAMQAYQQQHPGTDPVIAKRQFDSQWAKTYDVQAMRLKQAVDSGDKNGVNEVIREVGGAGSANARKLLGKVHAINQLSGEQ